MFPLTMLSCAILFSAVILDRNYFTLIKTTTSDLSRIFKSSGLGWDQCRYSVSMWKRRRLKENMAQCSLIKGHKHRKACLTSYLCDASPNVLQQQLHTRQLTAANEQSGTDKCICASAMFGQHLICLIHFYAADALISSSNLDSSVLIILPLLTATRNSVFTKNLCFIKP